MYMRWADLVTVLEVLYMSNFIQNWNWWEVLYMSNLIQTLYLRSCGKFWRQRWMLHSKLDTGNKLSTQTPSSAQWMGTRGHLKSVFSCIVIIGPESDHWECLSVTHWLTDSLTDCCLVISKLDWCGPGVWRCQLKTCWSCYCCSCWQQFVTDLGADVWS